MTHITINPNGTENGPSLIRRFTKMVRNSGIVMAVKGRRYYTRGNSWYKNQQSALRRIESTKQYEKLKKLGKIQERTYGNNNGDNKGSSN